MTHRKPTIDRGDTLGSGHFKGHDGPDPGSDAGLVAERAANLKLVKACVGDGVWNLNRWSQRDDVPTASKEQLDRIKVQY